MKGIEERLQSVSAYLAGAIIAAGLLVVAGWQFRIGVLKGAAFGTFVAPNTALCFIASGVSILLQWRPRCLWRVAGAVLGGMVAAFALATLLEYLLGADFGIDALFMSHRMSDWNLAHPGRFVINTAVGFFLAGVALVTLKLRVRAAVSELLALLLLLVAYLSLVGYLYGASALYDRIMAVHTAVLFGVLGAALWCAAARHPLLRVVLSPLAGSIASRTMLAAILVVFPAIGLAELWAERVGLVSVRFGTALSVVAAATFFTVLALRTASDLNETDRKRLASEEALIKSRQIETAGRLAASVAHEINNPLEAIGNILYLLRNGSLPPEVHQQYLIFAEEELGRVAALARRTLGFYKEDAKPAEIQVAELVESVLHIYAKRLSDKTVSSNLQPEAYINARPGEVRQVLANIVANAIDALPAVGGAIDIAARIEGEQVVITVRDNGHGIASEHLERIFDPLFSTKKEHGTGLGLWVSKDLITKNGGMVLVTSSTSAGEQGTTFTLRFPAARRPEREMKMAVEG